MSGDLVGNRDLRPLMKRVVPHPFESLASLLWRTCDANQYDRIRWISELGGIRHNKRSILSGDECAKLAILLDVDHKEIEHRAFLPTHSRRHQFFCHEVSRSQVEWGRIKYCPECLRSLHYLPAIHDLTLIQICPTHSISLTSECPECGKPFNFSGDTPGVCQHCHADLRDMSELRVDPEDLVALGIVARKAGLEQCDPDIPMPDAAFVSAFDHLKLSETMMLFNRLGGYAMTLPTERRWKTVIVNDRDNALQLLKAAWATLQNWPSNFYKLLDETANSAADDSRVGVRAYFESFYEYIAERPIEPWLSIQAAFNDYLNFHWAGLRLPARSNSRFISDDHRKNAQYIALNEASRLPNLGIAKVRQIVEAGHLATLSVEAAKGAGARPMVFVNQRQLAQIVPEGSALLTLDETAEKIGLSKLLTKRLVDEGVLQETAGPTTTSNKRYLISTITIKTFLEKIFPMPITEIPIDTISMKSLMKRQQTVVASLSDVFDAIFNKKLRGMRLEGLQDVGDICFFDADADEVIVGSISRASGTEFCTRSQVEQELSVNKRTASFLIDAEYIDLVEKRGNLKLLSMQSLRNFKADWVKLGDIAATARTSRTLAKRALDGIGLTSVRAGVGDEATTFFRRSEVEALDMSELLEKAAFYRGKSWAQYSLGLEQRKTVKEI